MQSERIDLLWGQKQLVQFFLVTEETWINITSFFVTELFIRNLGRAQADCSWIQKVCSTWFSSFNLRAPISNLVLEVLISGVQLVIGVESYFIYLLIYRFINHY